jgi:hypothetical protein
MKLLAIMLVLAAATWMFAACYRPLPTSGFRWRVAFGVLTLAGLLCGMCLVALTRNESPTLKVTGYPFTIAAAELVDGRWLGGLIARYHLLACVADVGLALFVFLAPFRLAQWWAQRTRRRHALTPNAA